ncbi:MULTISPECIES: NAD(P)-binding domain-containing protein [unclassified Streptomyces]|uniref:NAD(P)-binding domain-containing protein n=1 Tax=unclassified Streptomyces TaxID=2593676 RepID=UPI000892631F|nr:MULTISPECIES: NAD(P)-binding domain-containing protein [unclassified Streptomyces]PBC86438.1 catio diffusion facilitator CzcD-associated flavoprotein CzcO [Streptomyces sp. 2321.6]SDQ84372.1 Predicted flavoprotein CzcO associated with the cation diffusion facilitator CzcD [Streptomyces sp. KS_16]SED98536.1 Predicted flavoprotein CzcO associated with the cation diffusion facilitator CzcD [Streptomyces sp. 2133.1]SNC73367.1 Predicted flavoprotein CzcO associated with the cation diffusion facil
MNYTGAREIETGVDAEVEVEVDAVVDADAVVEAKVDVVVIGAGQAGLAAAFHLRRAGYAPDRDFVALDHSPRPGGAWQFRWPTLTYAKVHGMHALPGMELTGADPRRPSSEVIGAYFDRYEQAFGLRVHRPVSVTAVRESGGAPWTDPVGDVEGRRLLVETSEGNYAARALINATGTWDRPFWPRFPGQETFGGRQLHSSSYDGPEGFRDARVVVVGGGTSAVQQLMEIAPVAAATTWVTRRPPVFREGPFGAEQGRAAVALVAERVRQGLPPRSVVSVTGLPMTEAIRQARESGVLERLPLFERVTPTGVRWHDGRTVEADVILYATGFRAALDHLAPLHLREPGGGIRMDGTRTLRDPRIHLVGYGPSASTIGANRAGRAAVGDLRRLLGTPPRPRALPRPRPARAETGVVGSLAS